MAKSSSRRWVGWRTGPNQSTTGKYIGRGSKKPKKKKKKKVTTTHKQRAFIRSLNQQMGKNYSIPNSKEKASSLIEEMLARKNSQAPTDPYRKPFANA